tara:strand:+ start:558 stop:836 length:279 start_codon:yes stop_codon:yes gene_type:complete
MRKKEPKQKCEYCGGVLHKIGIERENGIPIMNKTGCDWKKRIYHKKCYKEIMLLKRIDFKRLDVLFYEEHISETEMKKKKNDFYVKYKLSRN